MPAQALWNPALLASGEVQQHRQPAAGGLLTKLQPQEMKNNAPDLQLGAGWFAASGQVCPLLFVPTSRLRSTKAWFRTKGSRIQKVVTTKLIRKDKRGREMGEREAGSGKRDCPT